MDINALFYYLGFSVMAAIVVGGALLTVSVRNVFHAGLSLVGTFFGIAGIYLLLEAEFLAIVQVLIYVGAISILILFAIMLTRGLMRTDLRSMNEQWGLALLVAIALFISLALIAVTFPWPVVGKAITTDFVGVLGKELVTTYVLPFEVVSLVLLAALIGAFVIAREAE